VLAPRDARRSWFLRGTQVCCEIQAILTDLQHATAIL
jgi:hypothetical protein